MEDETIPAIPTRTIKKKKKIRKGGKATRIAEWRSGSERWGAPAVGPRISLPGPSHLCDDSHPPYRPRPDSESLPPRSRDIEQADATGRPTWELEGGWGPIVNRTQPHASHLPRACFSALQDVGSHSPTHMDIWQLTKVWIGPVKIISRASVGILPVRRAESAPRKM